jgi:hypothetical protein
MAGVSRQSIYKAIAEGRLKAAPIDGVKFIRLTELQRWMTARGGNSATQKD